MSQPSEAPDGSRSFSCSMGSGSLPCGNHEAVSLQGLERDEWILIHQYAFTRAIAGHMLSNYDKVLKVDGNNGDKTEYDPRS